MPYNISEKSIKAGKEHRCSACNDIIQKGQECTRSVNRENTIYTIYACKGCHYMILKYGKKMETWDGLEENCVIGFIEDDEKLEAEWRAAK